MKIKELFADKDHWTQGTLARDSHGEEIGVREPGACSFCLIGAVIHCYPEEEQGKVRDALFEGTEGLIAYFNDNHEWEDVLALVTKLDV